MPYLVPNKFHIDLHFELLNFEKNIVQFLDELQI